MRKTTVKIKKDEANIYYLSFVNAELLQMAIKNLDGTITKDVDAEYFILTLEMPTEHEDLAPMIQALCFDRCKHFQKCRETYGDGTKEMETALSHYCKDCPLGSGYEKDEPN